MFRCQLTGDPVPPGIKPVKLVIKKRKVIYPPRRDANRVATWLEDKADKIYSTTDPGGEGWEIAQELDVSPKVAQKWLKKQEAGDVDVEWVAPREIVAPYMPPEKSRGGFQDQYHKASKRTTDPKR